MMLQALQESNDAWDAQIAERRLALVNEDIEAAQKQIISLENQKKSLNKQYQDLEFRLSELQSNLEDLENTRQVENNNSQDYDVEGTFFTLLSELESEEAALRGELQSYKDLQRDLGHQRAKYKQANQRMKKDHDLEKERLENEENRLKQSIDELNQLHIEIDSKTSYLNDIIQACTDLENEEMALSEELNSHGEGMILELKAQESSLRREYEDATKIEDKLKKDLVKYQRDHQNEIDSLTNELSKELSVANWKNDRTLLGGKLKKVKQQLVLEMQSLANAQSRREKLAIKCKTLLGEDDPGDATGRRAKQMVRAEIDSVETQRQPDIDEERKIENAYNQELNEQLKLLEQSLNIFRQHRDETLSSLNEELLECSQDGYLKLLKGEMDELKSAVSKI